MLPASERVPPSLFSLAVILLEPPAPESGTNYKLPRGTILTPLEPQFRFWGQTSQISSSLSPNRDCGSKSHLNQANDTATEERPGPASMRHAPAIC